MNVELEIIKHTYVGPAGIPGRMPYMGSEKWPWRYLYFDCGAYDMTLRATFFCEKCDTYKNKDIWLERPVPGKDFQMKRVVFACTGCEEPQFGFSGFNDSRWELWGRKV